MRGWIEHFVAASRWSAAGVAELFREEMAARMELAALVAGALWLALIGASWLAIAGFVVIAAIVLAVEALNTAIALIVDHLSPDRSDFARRTKDLGSAAVFFVLLGAGVYVLAATAVVLAG